MTKISIEAFNAIIKSELPLADDTGIYLRKLEPGQAFTFHGFRFQVLRKQGNRLTSLRITPVSKLKPARVAKPARPATGDTTKVAGE